MHSKKEKITELRVCSFQRIHIKYPCRGSSVVPACRQAGSAGLKHKYNISRGSSVVERGPEEPGVVSSILTLGTITKTSGINRRFSFGAGSGNRTRVSTLEGSHNSHYTMPADILRIAKCAISWSGRHDLNVRPPAPKAGTLAN